MKIVTARQMAELDRVTIHTYGIPALVLMENAGRSCADRIIRILEEKAGGSQEASVAVVCGKGNNGGDGMVIGGTCTTGAPTSRSSSCARRATCRPTRGPSTRSSGGWTSRSG